jgi:hypothetical protein
VSIRSIGAAGHRGTQTKGGRELAGEGNGIESQSSRRDSVARSTFELMDKAACSST